MLTGEIAKIKSEASVYQILIQLTTHEFLEVNESQMQVRQTAADKQEDILSKIFIFQENNAVSASYSHR